MKKLDSAAPPAAPAPPDRAALRLFRLRAAGAEATVLNLGCITRSWRAEVGGVRLSPVLGYEQPESYLDDPFYMGSIVGRVANRIEGARFTLEGRTYRLPPNEGPNLLHGGAAGLSRQIWQAEALAPDRLRLQHVSPDGADGAGGFPGAARFTVTITLEARALIYDMQAEVDRPTPISLAQHNYYSLAHGTRLRDHHLQLAAQAHTPMRADGVPEGRIAPLPPALDMRAPRRLGELPALGPGGAGLDENFVLAPGGGPAARLSYPGAGTLSLTTDQPGLQVYTAQGLGRHAPALAGQSLGPFAGICLEAQGFPNAVNTPAFPSIIATPARPYRQRLRLELAP